MPSLRLCTHIKTNGEKCGSPALRHHTLCYFHYQWQRRDQRRIRLGGPVGMNKDSGIELPLLDGPEAILVSIMEIQHALLDQRIPIKMGTALLYSLQLALQAEIPLFGLSSREAVRECPELDMELEMERAKSLRPAQEKCTACPKQETCLSPRNCRELPKLPPGIHREGDHLVRDFQPAEENDSSSRAESRSDAVEGPAFLPTGATTLATTTSPETSTHSLREHSPGHESRETGHESSPSHTGAPHLPQSADVGSPHAQRHMPTDAPPLLATGNWQPATIPHAHNILGSNPNVLIDLGGKFPQLVELKRAQK